MQNMVIRYILAIGFLFSTVTAGFATDMGIVTGGKQGTYYQFGLNLKELVKTEGINLKVANSNGSVENIYAVYKRPRTQLGIVQSDVLAFVSKVQNNPVLKRIAKKIKMVFPLYNEEVHLLGRQEIVDFDDLTGRRVAIGKEGSGTYLTAKLLFEVSEIQPSEIKAIGTDDALNQLKAGQIDAMFYVAGCPVKLFTEQVAAEDGLALIPILNKNITEFYPTVEIPADTYAWQNESLNTVAVKAVLVTFNFRHANCDNVGRVAQHLVENFQWLKENGHPKWQHVDLEYPLKGWDQYDCVKKYLGKTQTVQRRKPSGLNPVLDAIKDIL